MFAKDEIFLSQRECVRKAPVVADYITHPSKVSFADSNYLNFGRCEHSSKELTLRKKKKKETNTSKKCFAVHHELCLLLMISGFFRSS